MGCPMGEILGGNQQHLGAGWLLVGGSCFGGTPSWGQGGLAGVPPWGFGVLWVHFGGPWGDWRGVVHFGVPQVPHLEGVPPALVALREDLGVPQDFGGHHHCFGYPHGSLRGSTVVLQVPHFWGPPFFGVPPALTLLNLLLQIPGTGGGQFGGANTILGGPKKFGGPPGILGSQSILGFPMVSAGLTLGFGVPFVGFHLL